MGKVWMPGGGGGADLDVVTAGKPDVMAGKVIVDKDGEPLTGTMPNNGAVSQTLNAGGSYTIPGGYHNGSGKVTASSLASQTGATATAAHILSGQTAWVNGSKVSGGIPWQNSEVAGTDRAWATNISCWEGAACMGVRNAHYLNGVNWIQGNIPNFYAGNIKKGVNMGGLVGTFEGYVANPEDLYYRGNNVIGFKGIPAFDSGQITFKQGGNISATFNTVGHTYLNIQGYCTSSSQPYVRLSYTNADGSLTNASTIYIPSGDYTVSIPVNNYQMNASWNLFFYISNGAVFRVWLS